MLKPKGSKIKILKPKKSQTDLHILDENVEAITINHIDFGVDINIPYMDEVRVIF